MRLLSWSGPLALIGSVVYVYQANSDTTSKFFLSTNIYCIALFLVYCTGAIPRNPFFPPLFFRSNIFFLLYNLYCTERIGFHVLSRILHQHTPYPHSDYRYGVRCLSNCGLPLMRVPQAIHNTLTGASVHILASEPSDVAAANAHASVTSPVSTASPQTEYYSQGGGVIDLTRIAAHSPSRGVLVVPVPIFADNYAYLIISLATHAVAAVDPADPVVLLSTLRTLRRQCGLPLRLTDVLVTHKHWDHAGGNETLRRLAEAMREQARGSAEPHVGPSTSTHISSSKKHDGVCGTDSINKIRSEEQRSASSSASTRFSAKSIAHEMPALWAMVQREQPPLVSSDLVILGPREDNPMSCTRLIGGEEDAVFTVALGGVAVRALDVPGHTCGHVMYVVGDTHALTADTFEHSPTPDTKIDVPSAPAERIALFTGDSLFIGGCGAPFETTSLAQVRKTRYRFLCDHLSRTHPATGRRIDDGDVLVYVGHEYTERLLDQLSTILARQTAQSCCSPACAAYAAEVGQMLREVKAMRVSSNVFDHSTNEKERVLAEGVTSMSSTNTATNSRFRLPHCTVPSTLRREMRTNPLLTVDNAALDACQTPSDGLDKNMLECTIFGSSARNVC